MSAPTQNIVFKAPPQKCVTIHDHELFLAGLIAAKAKIREGWCKHTFARTVGGAAVGPTSGYAASWCLVGALSACGIEGFEWDKGGQATDSPFKWNDSANRTQKEVLDVLDASIVEQAKFIANFKGI